MRLGKLLRTSAFRMALGYLALFGVSGLALAIFVFWTTAGFIERQIDETIQAEITGLAEQYRRTGLAGLSEVVRERSRNQRQSLYLLTSPAGARLVGNLDAWPAVPTQPGGWLDFAFERPTGERIETHQARARHLRLVGGFQLLVGRDVEERQEIGRRIRRSLIWAVALTICLGIAGGVAMSRNMLRRIDQINSTSRDIMSGDLGRRVPVSGNDDELDRLARNLNSMLDQIERLMTGMQRISDNIAHDLRTPLTRLRNRLDVSLMEQPSIEAYQTAMKRTIEEADGLLGTFNALLLIAQTEAGAEREEMTALDLGALARDVVELYEPVAEEKEIALELVADENAQVRANRHLLSQALANLVDNAIKYTPAGGGVTVSARRTNAAAAELTVADSGPGIPPDDRERVLERFVRLETSRHSGGSGLGLSLVQAVARLHHAELRLEDNAPGLRVLLRFG
ncbi:MAG: ATP-binding protein [Alphaproteobacteria bacterium]